MWWCCSSGLFLSKTFYNHFRRKSTSNWWKTRSHPSRLFCFRQRWWKLLLSRHLCYGPWWCLDCHANSNCFHPMWDAYPRSHRCHQSTNSSTKHFRFWTCLGTENPILQNRVRTRRANPSTSLEPTSKLIRWKSEYSLIISFYRMDTDTLSVKQSMLLLPG